jgi:hypothetical protein
MKKIFFFVVVLCMAAGTAAAGDMTGRIGLGFTSLDAPVGLRYWFTPRMGVDLGFGYHSFGDFGGGDRLNNYTVAAALPINIHRVGDRVSFNFLPGVAYSKLEDVSSSYYPGKFIDISARLEFEVFVTQDLSVSAAHGVMVSIINPDDSTLDNVTDFNTTGSNLTEFGVHYYLPGK